ncbi:hypothetical protein ACVWWO_004517 [Bradyrhizobium sp. F1.13.1]
MSGAFLHTLFDIAAWLAAAVALYWLSRQGLLFPAQSFERSYLAALVFGAGLGAYLFGSANLWLSGQSGIARSVEGALAGGIGGDRALQMVRRDHGANRRPFCAAAGPRHRDRPARLLFRGP